MKESYTFSLRNLRGKSQNVYVMVIIIITSHLSISQIYKTDVETTLYVRLPSAIHNVPFWATQF